MPEHPIRLVDPIFTSADACRLAGLSDKSLRNWLERGVLPPTGVRFAGRLAFSLADVLRLAALSDLTARVLMPPAEAVKVAELAVRQIVQRSPGGIASLDGIPSTLALAVAWIDSAAHVQLIDPAVPDFADWRSDWGRAHAVLPLSGLLARVLWAAIDVLAARQGGVA